jgi:hypothetical protein
MEYSPFHRMGGAIPPAGSGLSGVREQHDTVCKLVVFITDTCCNTLVLCCEKKERITVFQRKTTVARRFSQNYKT